MQKLMEALKSLLINLLAFLLGKQYGKASLEKEQAENENEALKKKLDVVLNGDYSPDAISKRVYGNKTTK